VSSLPFLFLSLPYLEGGVWRIAQRNVQKFVGGRFDHLEELKREDREGGKEERRKGGKEGRREGGKEGRREGGKRGEGEGRTYWLAMGKSIERQFSVIRPDTAISDTPKREGGVGEVQEGVVHDGSTRSCLLNDLVLGSGVPGEAVEGKREGTVVTGRSVSGGRGKEKGEEGEERKEGGCRS
jgi:hypothetical protein